MTRVTHCWPPSAQYKRRIEESNKITLCDLEYKVSWKNIIPYETDKISQPKILGFDIEVNSNYNLISKTPDYKTSFEAKKVF